MYESKFERSMSKIGDVLKILEEESQFFSINRGVFYIEVLFLNHTLQYTRIKKN